MRREISEVKPVETKSRENYLDSSVRKAFERLQEGKTARAENKLDASVIKSKPASVASWKSSTMRKDYSKKWKIRKKIFKSL